MCQSFDITTKRSMRCKNHNIQGKMRVSTEPRAATTKTFLDSLALMDECGISLLSKSELMQWIPHAGDKLICHRLRSNFQIA